MPINFHIVEPGRLYRSGLINPNDIRTLSMPPFNVKRVISLDMDIAKNIAPYLKKYNIQHVVFPLDSGNVRIVSEKMRQKAQQLFTINNGAILVHCKHGRDRTGFAIALYNIVIKGLDCVQVIQQALKSGYGAGISEAYLNQLNATLCKACKSSHLHYCNVIDKTAQDIASLVENDLSYSVNPANSFGPVTNMYGDIDHHTITPQQSYSAFFGESEDVLGRNSYSFISKNKRRRQARKKIIKKIIKMLDELNVDLDIMPSVGYRDNYTGMPESKFMGSTAVPGAPGAGGFVDGSSGADIW